MRKLLLATCAALALLTAGGAGARDLARVGPIDTVNGFPKWYQDHKGLVLDLCLPDMNDPGNLQYTACLMELPAPYTFPTHFPDESFYFRAVSDQLATGPNGQRAVLVLALEAAFAQEAPAAGDQVVFTRIRVVAGVEHPGDYVVTHPYGTEKFFGVTNTGDRDIVFTEDIGIAPGQFTGALNSRLGPFLRKADGTFVTLNGGSFLSDGATLETVTGSPMNPPTNYFEICGPVNQPTLSRCYRTDLFTLTGRVHDFANDPIGSPITVDRATYSRSGSAVSVDVAATAIAGLLPNGAPQAPPSLNVGAPALPPVKMKGPNDPLFGKFYAQALPTPATAVPSLVTVTNSSDVPPSSVVAKVVDDVTVLSASYNPTAQTLVVVATSSDKGDTATGITPPVLDLVGLTATLKETGIVAGDPASVRFTVNGLAVAPVSVTVSSQRDGAGNLNVTMAKEAVSSFAAGVPFAADDSATTTVGAAAITLNVKANDVAANGLPTAPGLALIGGPTVATQFGTATVSGESIQFTPSTAFAGTAEFKYTVSNATGTSNPAVVRVVVQPGAAGPVPVAVADSYTVYARAGRVLDVLRNDNGNGSPLVPSSVLVETLTAGTVTGISPTTGAISYAAPAAPTTVRLEYSVANEAGNRSNRGVVDIVVLPAETITVTRARCRNGNWDLRGTSTALDNNTVTVYLNDTLDPMPAALQPLGAPAAVQADGTWTVKVDGVACDPRISLQSAYGTKVNNITTGR